MPNVIKRAIAKRKENKARRSYERDSKYIIDDFGPIASAFARYWRLGNPYEVVDRDETNDDTSSMSSFSTTATTDDNPGAGWTVDKYFYQPVGRRIENLAFQISMPFLSPFRIFQYIEEHHFNGALSFDQLFMPMFTNLDSVYLAGLNSLIHQTQ